MQNKVRIIPSEAPKLVNSIRANIIEALNSKTAEISAVPSVEHFRSIEGTNNGHTFKVEYLASETHGNSDQLYVSYDNFEFFNNLDSDFGANDFFRKIDEFTRKKYLYDLNTQTYVIRPKELNFFQDVAQWIRSKTRSKVK